MKASIYLILLAACAFETAQAIGTRGGGNTLICFSDASIPAKIKELGDVLPTSLMSSIISIETFDLYEAKKEIGIEKKAPKLFEPKADEKPSAFIERLIQRYDSSVPRIREIVEAGRAQFQPQNVTWEPNGVVKVTDYA